MLGELFDPHDEVQIHELRRPHWFQPGTIVFITFRTHDSIPKGVLHRWETEKHEWLRQRGYETDEHWTVTLTRLSDAERAGFQTTFRRQREMFLDTCCGRCWLKRPEVATIGADALLHFDGDRYRMGDFVVMPNHVHLLAAFHSIEDAYRQCDSWLHFTAVRINKLLRRTGKFWQQEPFDHLVRGLEQYEYLRRYIAENPQQAGLKAGEYLLHRYDG